TFNGEELLFYRNDKLVTASLIALSSIGKGQHGSSRHAERHQGKDDAGRASRPPSVRPHLFVLEAAAPG
ncbi:hypothetical protein, partial [Brevibacillus agri]|uniref:hypothetical protein n=1 Tax=Brevibacillus agri TaxID=51101 RepID=UPI003D233B29